MGVSEGEIPGTASIIIAKEITCRALSKLFHEHLDWLEEIGYGL